MDCGKVGRLILALRKEKGMTQKALAARMNISDRTISKWERGIGCPDVSLLCELSAVLGVHIEKILSGDLAPNDKDRGNMKKLKFYVCPDCANVFFGTGNGEISCCGRKCSALTAQKEDAAHAVRVKEIEDDFYISLQHEMSKQHYIAFAACVSYDRVLLVKLYPEQSAEVRLPQMRGSDLYICCNKHGLIKIDKIKQDVRLK